jgi:uncharacterized protein HemY
MKNSTSVWRDFVSYEKRVFTFALGKNIASSLSGFVAGVVIASVVWFAVYSFNSLLIF